jgi:Domain of unknown function (DUF2828)
MSTFVAAMDNVASGMTADGTIQRGENGAPEYTTDGVGDARVALFFALVRGITGDRIRDLLEGVLNMGGAESAADAIVMAFQTRNCRGGKGERDISYIMLLTLYETFPDTVQSLLPLIPHYGSYKDWFRLVALATRETKYEPLVAEIVRLASEQLQADQIALRTSNKISLLAKWAPREKRLFGKQVGALANHLFPDSRTPKQSYRMLVASLNRAIQTTEIKMSLNDWDDIDFKNVPSLCLMKHRKAFLNESVNSTPSDAEESTGNRYPDDEKRVACRKRLGDAMLEEGKRKLNGKQLFPHEIAKQLMHGTTSSMEKTLMQSQWAAIRESVKEAMGTLHETGDRLNAINLGNLVPLTDVSASMDGTPMEAAIGLSILVSELAAPEFANRFLTFESVPQWVVLNDGMDIAGKVKATQQASWGGSTDFSRALELILETAANAKLSPNEIPDLIVFSDMQFDEANQDSEADSWETSYDYLVRRFKETGLSVCGKPWPIPHIIYWNLRGDTHGYPANADQQGVTMLSGFSPSLLKMLMSGEDVVGVDDIAVEIDDTGEEVVNDLKKKKTPYMTLRAVIDDVEYDPVRQILARSKEGVLSEYDFAPAIMDRMDGDWVTNVV